MDLEELTHGFSLSSVTVVILLLIFSYTPAEGTFRVIGSPQPIVAALGDDIVLPCHVQPQVDVTGLTVEWSKPDLLPDPRDRLRRVEYVHLYRDTREDLDMKIASYVKRTDLFADGLKRGNISLKITNVKFEDEGRYKCFIPKLKSQSFLFRSSILHLSVEPKSVTTDTPLQPTSPQTPHAKKDTDVNGGPSRRNRLITGVCVGVFSMILLAVVVAVYWRHKRLKQKIKKEPVVGALLEGQVSSC